MPERRWRCPAPAAAARSTGTPARLGWPWVRVGSGRDSGTTCLTVSGWAGRAGRSREHRVDRRLQRRQLAAEAGVEAVPDLAGGRAALHRGRVGDLGDQVVQVGGGDGPQLQRPPRGRSPPRRGCRPPPARPGPGRGATVTASATIPARTARPASSSRVRAGGRISGQRAGQHAQLIREISHGNSQMTAARGQVGLPGAERTAPGRRALRPADAGTAMPIAIPAAPAAITSSSPPASTAMLGAPMAPRSCTHRGGGADQQQAGGHRAQPGRPGGRRCGCRPWPGSWRTGPPCRPAGPARRPAARRPGRPCRGRAARTPICQPAFHHNGSRRPDERARPRRRPPAARPAPAGCGPAATPPPWPGPAPSAAAIRGRRARPRRRRRRLRRTRSAPGGGHRAPAAWDSSR